MKTRTSGYVFVGLGVCLLLALFVSPFASSKPDGLEKVAETRGFAGKGEGPAAWQHAPLRNYSFPGIRNEKLSTALAGFVGTLSIFFLVFGVARLIRKPSEHSSPCSKK